MVDPGLNVKADCTQNLFHMAKLCTLHGFTKGVSKSFVLMNK